MLIIHLKIKKFHSIIIKLVFYDNIGQYLTRAYLNHIKKMKKIEIISAEKTQDDYNGVRFEHVKLKLPTGEIKSYFRKSNVPNFSKPEAYNAKKLHDISHEAEVLSILHSDPDPRKKYIVDFAKFYTNGEINYLLLEWLPLGDMFSFIELFLCKKDISATLKLQLSMYFTEQLIQALSYLHSKYLVYADLKLENILMTENKTIKFCDFVTVQMVSNFNEEKINSSSMIGTAEYHAPEISKLPQRISQKSDIYSLGIVILMIFFADEALYIQKDIHKFINDKIQSNLYTSDQIDILTIILQCVDESPDRRPDINVLSSRFNKYKNKYFIQESLDNVLSKLDDFFKVMLVIKQIEAFTLAIVFERIDSDSVLMYKKSDKVELLLKHNFEESEELRAAKYQKINDEINILKELEHPNITQIQYTFERDVNLGFAVPCLQNLHEFYKKCASVRLLKIVIKDILSAVTYIHSQGILHGNLSIPLVFDVYQKSLYGRITVTTKLRDFASASILQVSDENSYISDIVSLSYLLYYLFLPANSNNNSFDFYLTNTTNVLREFNDPSFTLAADVIDDCQSRKIKSASQVTQRFFATTKEHFEEQKQKSFDFKY